MQIHPTNDMKITYCPFCKSAPDTVQEHSHWACGVMFRDKNWRTKECHKREVKLLKERIKELEKAGDAIADATEEIAYDSYDKKQIEAWRKVKEAK